MALATTSGGWTPGDPGTPLGYAIAVITVWATGLLMLIWMLDAHQRQAQRLSDTNHSLLESIELQHTQNEALQTSEKRFSTIVQFSPVPIAISHLQDGRYIDVNPAWEREFGWSRVDAVSHTSVELGFWTDQNERRQWMLQFERDGRSLGHEVTVRTHAGEQRTVLLSAERIDYDGVVAIVSIIVDVTRSKRIEAELKHLNEMLEERVTERTRELAQSNSELSTAMASLQRAQKELVQSEKQASMGRLVAGIAHELNTPIGNALTASSTLGDEFSLFEKRLTAGNLKRSQLMQLLEYGRAGTDIIDRALQRAASLVQSFKQVAVDQSSERRRRFALHEVIHGVIETLRPSLVNAPYTLEVDIPEGLELDSYPGALDQIVMNLLNNAAVHAFEGRQDGHVRLSACRDGDQVELRCTDDGVGIPSDIVGRVFDPFFTTKLGHGGSGLGLAIVLQLATQVLHGQIYVESRSGEGATFILRIPLSATSECRE